MKTLIINGSTRKNGDVSALLCAFTAELKGEYTVISADDGVSPCVDCRRCKRLPGCSINDKMREILENICEYDNIVIASPVWFCSLSGVALDICSRFQTFFCASHFRNEKQRTRRGVIIVSGGMAGTEKNAIVSAKVILSCLGVGKDDITVVASMNTDEIPACNDAVALEAARQAAKNL